MDKSRFQRGILTLCGDNHCRPQLVKIHFNIEDSVFPSCGRIKDMDANIIFNKVFQYVAENPDIVYSFKLHFAHGNRQRKPLAI